MKRRMTLLGGPLTAVAIISLVTACCNLPTVHLELPEETEPAGSQEVSELPPIPTAETAEGYLPAETQPNAYSIMFTEQANVSQVWTNPRQSFSDFSAEVEVSFDTDVEVLNAGLLFRWQDADNWCYFGITNEGRYDVVERVDGESERVSTGTSPYIARGAATNRLKVMAIEDSVSLYVNDEHVAGFVGCRFSEGRIGLGGLVDTESPITTQILFDNLCVYAATGTSQVLFEDDFSDPASGWEEGDYECGSVAYEDGTYCVTALGECDEWGAANRAFGDVVIDVEATQVSAPAENLNDYGVICRMQPNGDGYLLLITGDGGCAIAKWADVHYEMLVEYTYSDAVLQGNATNHIRAVCDGPDLSLHANGELVAQATDYDYTEGDIAFTAASYGEESTEICFDNLRVSEAGAMGGSSVGSTPIFEDDFSDPNSGWPVQEYTYGRVGYVATEEGEEHVQVSPRETPLPEPTPVAAPPEEPTPEVPVFSVSEQEIAQGVLAGISLAWDSTDDVDALCIDLDLHIVDPDGCEVSKSRPSCPSGVKWVEEEQEECDPYDALCALQQPFGEYVEIDTGAAPRGEYKIFVSYAATLCDGDDEVGSVDWFVNAGAGTKRAQYSGKISPGMPRVHVATLTL